MCDLSLRNIWLACLKLNFFLDKRTELNGIQFKGNFYLITYAQNLSFVGWTCALKKKRIKKTYGKENNNHGMRKK